MGSDKQQTNKTLDGGKGWAQRPVDRQKFDENWDRIFNKEKFDEDFEKIFGVDDDGKSGC